MGRISTDDKKRMSSFMTDFWAAIKDFAEPEDNENYWDSVIDTLGNLNKRYKANGKDDPIVRHLIQGFMDGLDEKRKEAKANG